MNDFKKWWKYMTIWNGHVDADENELNKKNAMQIR